MKRGETNQEKVRKHCATLLLLLCFGASAAWASPKHGDISSVMRKMEHVPSKSLISKAYALVQRNQPDSALIYYSVVANRYEYEGKGGSDDVYYAVNALTNMAYIHINFDYDIKKAYTYLLRAQEIGEAEKTDRLLPAIYNGFVNVFAKMQDGDTDSRRQLAEMLKKAFWQSVRNRNHLQTIISFINLVGQSIENRQTTFNKELSTFDSIHFPPHTALLRHAKLLSKGYAAYLRHDLKAAAQHFEVAANHVEISTSPVRYQINALGIASKTYQQAGCYARAERLLHRQLALADSASCQDWRTNIYKDLSQLSQLKGDVQLAQQYDYEFLKAKDSLDKASNVGHVRDIKFSYDLQKANDKMRMLSERQRLQEVLLTIAVCVLIMFAYFSIRLTRSNRKVRQSHQCLYQANQELLAEEAEMKGMLNELRSKLTTPCKPRYLQSRLTEEDAKELYARIISLFENSEEIYDVGFSIDQLSKLACSNVTYVSQAINSQSGKSFTALLTRFRIREACRRLNDPARYGAYTVEAIAESVGFKSRTAFAKNFKLLTGLTPSAYQSMARKRHAMR